MNRQDKIKALLRGGASLDRIARCRSVDDLYDCMIANDRFTEQIERYGDRVFDDSPKFGNNKKFKI